MSASRASLRASERFSSEITPAATEEEAAAVVAAIEALWPRPTVAGSTVDRRPGMWKFSGRWWSQPIPLRRARPWV